MKKTIVIIFLLLGLSATLYSQSINKNLQIPNFKIDSNKPIVYISFEKFDGDDVLLRINNNLNWAISCKTIGIYADPGKVKLIELVNGTKVLPLWSEREVPIIFYNEIDPEIESNKNQIEIPNLTYSHGRETAWIAAGSSALFKVPQIQIKKGLRLYVPIHFEWEASGRIVITDSVEHRVYFSGSNIPF